jgi:hypothetical protein
MQTMRWRRGLITAVVVMGLLLGAGASHAVSPSASIMYTETNLGGGSWQYDYLFTNTSDPGSSLYKIFLFFDHSASVTGSPLPTGWFGIPWEGSNTTSFLQTMSLSPSTDVAPGSSLSGFSFTVDYRAGDLPFTAEFDNGAGGGISVWRGTTTVVPEPVSTVLFVAGGAALALRKRFRKHSDA